MIKSHDYSAAELDQFRHYQRLSYDILGAVAGKLQVGVSEREAAYRMRKAFHVAGAHNYFHVPVALFGERSAYPGEFGAFEALPTDRTLNEGDTFILDAAPIFGEYTVDTSCAYEFGSSDTFRRLDHELIGLRSMIKDGINAGRSMQKVAWQVDDYIRQCGFENCHRKHIGAVLGHRVTKADSTRLATWAYKGLAVKQVSWFLSRSQLARLGLRNLTPNWNHTRMCKDVVPQGLWAVEPHVALDGVGVKFEEILVIDSNGARWLDDKLPHHLRWENNSEAYSESGAGENQNL